MEIPERIKNRLISELDYVIQKTTQETDAARKFYFLSAAHGAIERAMRFHKENELIMAHAIMSLVYNVILDRFNRNRAGDRAVPLPDDWHTQIIEHLSSLRDLINQGESVYPALERMMLLAYSVTGPGYYTLGYLESLEES